MQNEKHDYTALSFTSDTEQNLWFEIDDWLEGMLITGWHEIEFVSIVFSQVDSLHHAVVTCKITANEDVFKDDKDESKTEETDKSDSEDLPF